MLNLKILQGSKWKNVIDSSGFRTYAMTIIVFVSVLLPAFNLNIIFVFLVLNLGSVVMMVQVLKRVWLIYCSRLQKNS